MWKFSIHDRHGDKFEVELVPWKNHELGDGTFKLMCTDSGDQLAFGEEWIDKWGYHQVDVEHTDSTFDPRDIVFDVIAAHKLNPRVIPAEEPVETE